ncbi:hypothetical protein EVAR_86214_1 [Eumeta japonica]|uniref:Uncharacterized protein n=1 Tax=Eumeta variegata TaxID=151549 RepID=A0A4C1UBV4_EUMVA|nr:hypothetical protein EVAR_86214_1 [Eumeta japonica]
MNRKTPTTRVCFTIKAKKISSNLDVSGRAARGRSRVRLQSRLHWFLKSKAGTGPKSRMEPKLKSSVGADGGQGAAGVGSRADSESDRCQRRGNTIYEYVDTGQAAGGKLVFYIRARARLAPPAYTTRISCGRGRCR